MIPLFVSFYTPSYRLEAMALIDTLDAFDLAHCVTAIDDLGKWELNCNAKASFIRHALIAYDRPIVWLDADSRVRQTPTLFDALPPDADFAVHHRRGYELISATMWFNNTPNTKVLLDEWVKECEANPMVWDQINLANVIEREKRWDVQELPAAYCALFDDESLCPKDERVIEQLQASRKLKHVR